MFIIAKYAKEHYPNGKASIKASIADTYTARRAGIYKEYYHSKEEAEEDLKKAEAFNPTVGYGILELDPGD